ncbi:MAG: hypothetical protein SLAVMIC_00736 [uncultured marine phage]|uniref:Uncharacterized protein n=1 Tax=uncultured marine phage TaxID=707152 RepID=A0A8D9CCL6_9VIRU|nr:MAG: hypothetical protein SLAVMIC_00736 [uncultured marine phage]
MKFKRYIVVDLVYNQSTEPDYMYMYSSDSLDNIPEYKRMSVYRKVASIRDFGFCDGAEGTMIVDSTHSNLTGLYKDLLEDIKYQARDQRLGKLLDKIGI